MAHKQQFMVSVDEGTLARLDALRIVMGISRAEVGRQALLQGGLRALEVGVHPRLVRLYMLSEKHDQSWEEYVTAYVQRHRQGGPMLEELERSTGIERIGNPDVTEDPSPVLPLAG